jgi:uncharacterized membrane protein YphA (DoxX/SURF4 family)
MGKQHSKSSSASAWVWVCRLLVGLLFIFSGFIKANDPLGFSYKLQEYFEVFHITFLDGLALYMAVVLCALEMILGFALLIGVRGKQVAWGLLLLIIFFGFLTFYSAYFKVVQTCGCFGDAIPLTPWQSFSKDMALLLLVLVLFKHRANIQPIFSPKTSDRLLIIAVIGAFAFGFYTYNFSPIMDFLPYKIDANIPDEMKRPPNAQPDVYEQTYHLKNKATGATKVMNDKEYISSNIWKDSNWQIVGQPESRLVKKGFTPKIQDLAIYDSQHNDYTNELITNPFPNLMVVAWDLDHTNIDAINQINAMALDLRENYNTRVVLLTASPAPVAEAFAKQHKLVFELFYADDVPLKEMVRANPGVLLLKNGTILNKWHYHRLPKYDDLVKQYFQKQ